MGAELAQLVQIVCKSVSQTVRLDRDLRFQPSEHVLKGVFLNKVHVSDLRERSKVGKLTPGEAMTQ